jgi:hypothetical protein
MDGRDTDKGTETDGRSAGSTPPLTDNNGAEPVFVGPLRSPEIDSQPGGPVRQPYMLYRPARQRRLAASIPRNRFLGSINVYKYGLGGEECCTVYSGRIFKELLRSAQKAQLDLGLTSGSVYGSCCSTFEQVGQI